ncbi:N-acetyllactosaminide alpha-1,3-galactosyltransferase-like isoform X4 [Scyliorhinus canicula]|uniref:N-acetyllactosaminide alpha-1,3-galactosyltransferase-like isoform X4 n=1 Tax=Scyliorhinus canicula TaxID=7830 RepID=UPI0018F6F612|nr:N-acetyllactosaminide alpha-1,3-galactosyltransferase-like isoform X4 [Scyliorhinus canicula]
MAPRWLSYGRYFVTKHKCVSLVLAIIVIYSVMGLAFFRFMEGLIPMDVCHLSKGFKSKPGNHVDNYLDYWYLDMYLENFLVSADEYFMPGFPVIYYVFVDDLLKLEKLRLRLRPRARRKIKEFKVEKHKRWQDISMFRMRKISRLIEDHVKHEANYVFCFDVDQRFQGRFGTEALSESVALLHAWFYRRPKFMYTYDRNPLSAAYLESEGDFYYHAAVFGGTWQRVKNLTETCDRGIMQDKQKNVEAVWHDESHLNKYFWLHKPTKILSPEYCWDPMIGWRRDIRVVRLLWAKKQYDISRQTN